MNDVLVPKMCVLPHELDVHMAVVVVCILQLLFCIFFKIEYALLD